ncbi:hypothetical protein Bwad005_25130 [Bilophila wadsworthia]
MSPSACHLILRRRDWRESRLTRFRVQGGIEGFKGYRRIIDGAAAIFFQPVQKASPLLPPCVGHTP